MEKVRVGIVNTGWWADAMYLPALTAHPDVVVTAVCGRQEEKARAFAKKWQVENTYVDYRVMLSSGVCDAVIVASHNNTHYEIVMAAIHQGIHVLCEKPLAMNVGEASEMTAASKAKKIKTLVPYTYRFLPHARYMKQLIDDGFIGTPYHLNIRYYHAFGREPGYGWGWDAGIVGEGDLANLASHPIYLAHWYFGAVESVTAELIQSVDRGQLTPAGKPFTAVNDNGILVLRFENGASGSIHYSSVAHEKSCFDQHHAMEFHGSEGSLHHVNDWVQQQETYGIREGETQKKKLVVPDAIWGHAKSVDVHESYKAVFRRDRFMVGEFIDSILGRPIRSRTPLPSFKEGLFVQQVIDAAALSSKEGRRVYLKEIEP
ncbi:MAG: Gfo/Idh/MocA family oxidoreductase [Rhodothermaceae bacterium]|nr:Gfo/Idh/MocA family oxidoreductase [Rhodothermaceae bacterium]